jgi:hypothetical protein
MLDFSHKSLLGDVDSVQELSVILATDLADLGDLCAWEWDVLVVNSFEDELVLEIWVQLDGGAGKKLDLLDLFTSEEVLDFDGSSILGDHNVNGEMSVNESHLVSVALYHILIIINNLKRNIGNKRTVVLRIAIYIDGTIDHVADEWLESSDRAALLGATEPHLDVKVETLPLLGSLLHDFHLNWHVFEALGDLTLGSLHLHLSCLHSHSHYKLIKTVHLPFSGMWTQSSTNMVFIDIFFYIN